MSEDDLLLREALRNLECIMAPATRAEYAEIMYPKKDAQLSRERAEVRQLLGRSR